MITDVRTRMAQTAMGRLCSLQFVLTVFCTVLPLISVFGPAASASLIGNRSNSNEIMVSNLQELNLALSSAKPGDVIVMKNGAWHNAVIDFNANATSSAPVTLRAETSGEVILDGNSKLTFSKPNLVVDGLFFKQGAIENGSVINFNSDNCQLTNAAIVDYNPAQFETGYYWVYFKGNNNRLDHCYLKGKATRIRLSGMMNSMRNTTKWIIATSKTYRTSQIAMAERSCKISGSTR